MTDDAPEIARLLSSGFAPEFAQLLIYGCKGASEYIRMLVTMDGQHAESLYLVARASDSIAGAVELRRTPHGLFLNYIGVDASRRGQRVGTALLAGAVNMADVDTGEFGLDVLEANSHAMGWYTGLGFTKCGSAEFVEIAAPAGEKEEVAYVSGLPQADVCHERFGFSRFDLITKTGRFPVGRMGEHWFRLIDPEGASDPGVFAALRLLDPRRRDFAVLPAEFSPIPHVVRSLARVHRMKIEIPRLIAGISNGF